MLAKAWLALALEAVVFAGILFGAAGTLRWVAAWVFLALFFAFAAEMTQMLARHHPDLLRERLGPIVQRSQPWWDKLILVILVPGFFGWLVLLPLDAVRFAWTSVSPPLQVVGGLGLVMAMWLIRATLAANPFAAPVVKLQAERAHRVVTSGPYAVVRHPMYSGAILLFPSVALMLGSWWGVAASGALIAVVILRTALEDHALARGLAGYREYARRVRSRLVPRLW